jgi:hypothetical protein
MSISKGKGDLWRRAPDLPFQTLAEETIVVDPERREVHLLNETAARVWQLLESPQSVEQLVAALEEDYDAAAEELRASVVELMSDLESKRLLLAV